MRYRLGSSSLIHQNRCESRDVTMRCVVRNLLRAHTVALARIKNKPKPHVQQKEKCLQPNAVLLPGRRPAIAI